MLAKPLGIRFRIGLKHPQIVALIVLVLAVNVTTVSAGTIVPTIRAIYQYHCPEGSESSRCPIIVYQTQREFLRSVRAESNTATVRFPDPENPESEIVITGQTMPTRIEHDPGPSYFDGFEPRPGESLGETLFRAFDELPFGLIVYDDLDVYWIIEEPSNERKADSNPDTMLQCAAIDSIDALRDCLVSQTEVRFLSRPQLGIVPREASGEQAESGVEIEQGKYEEISFRELLSRYLRAHIDQAKDLGNQELNLLRVREPGPKAYLEHQRRLEHDERLGRDPSEQRPLPQMLIGILPPDRIDGD